MARVKGPLMSLDAAGTFAAEMRYRSTPDGVLVYRGGDPYSKRPKRVSIKQRRQREMYRDACALWHQLSPASLAEWETIAAKYPLSTFSVFVGAYLRGLDLSTVECHWLIQENRWDDSGFWCDEASW
jgi:hypothetical protein